MEDDEDVPSILLPCAICARTFAPKSLEKHAKICEKSSIKKRKPFDSAKQRIQGTELEEFLPKQENKRSYQDERIPRTKSSWKLTHDEFLRTIRAARGEPTEVITRQSTNQITSGAPTRANEKGICPTCYRQFGIKAYERHVAWCKERSTRLPVSPATNVAKERLEARIRYRAPALKNRRPTVREKYMPGSISNLGYNTAKVSSVHTIKTRESVSLPNCNKSNETPSKQKLTSRKQNQSNISIPTGPLKSRPVDRANRCILPDRPAWNNYVRKHPDFFMVLKGRTCGNKTYDPFLMAEQQMQDLLSDTSDQFSTDGQSNHKNSSVFPLTHSSAFVTYPSQSLTNSAILESSKKRGSVLAPPTEFDDLTSELSSDCTETNSEHFVNDKIISNSTIKEKTQNPEHILSRRVIIDKSKALGIDDSLSSSIDKTRKILDKISTQKIVRPMVNRSHSVRSVSAQKIPERKNSSSSSSDSLKNNFKYSKNSNLNYADRSNNNKNNFNDISKNRSSSYTSTLNGSNLSLNSCVSSDIDMKRSNSMFDELMSSFEEDNSTILPSLKSFLKSDPLSMSSPIQSNVKRNGQISDDELSSIDSFKRQDHGKLSADSAYSSLNRKYYNNGRSSSDMASRLDEDPPARYREGDSRFLSKSKMSKFCHECGSRFPESAKFCCECGIKRLTL
ncbi:uncharacterized protein LOC122506798 isoform X3 [Leptopilina heterotoma]|uniref:uncharacterized protein LOC122506798 isoform X3 n=1 Tax=Leptopilina heterotoma TaxID=63436 RepID=UPI001CA8B25E|nr:uncharacterized protein LOC122506798 isoform X3 [Leptopilina heterotoma]XP_043475058.1 uncharacterized protein LOC122506798 isoform X3 [Leptopilina heterotoma]